MAILTATAILGVACASDRTPATGPDEESLTSDQVVEVSPNQVDILKDGSFQLSVEVTDPNGSPVQTSISWASQKPEVASVDGEGNVFGREVGATSIIAASDGVADTAGVGVVPEPPSAFPGAEGHGAKALTQCNRGSIQLLRVTNLRDSGPGSLRDALSAVSDDVLSVVVFDVAGYIDASDLIVRKNCLYIAGQTAPGDGITIRPKGKGLFLRDDVHDVVIRHLRIRGGYHGDSRGHVGLLIGSGTDIILDHLSLGWTTNYLLGILKSDIAWSQPISRISVQRTILHEVLAAHPTAAQITGEGESQWSQVAEISLHQNLFAHNHHRNPANNTHGLRFVNNVVYNWRQGAVQNGQEARLDAISNYFKSGPMTHPAFDWEITWNCNTTPYQPSFYLEGNIGPNNSDPGADNWTGESRMVACYYRTGAAVGQVIPNWSKIRRTSPLPSAVVPVDIQSATAAYESVLDDVGANARLKCDGEWASRSDAVDERIIANVRGGSGPSQAPQTEVDVGGFPSISSGSPCADGDGDGMPDEYEYQYGFDPGDPLDAARDSDSDGYTNLEEFLNGTPPRD